MRDLRALGLVALLAAGCGGEVGAADSGADAPFDARVEDAPVDAGTDSTADAAADARADARADAADAGSDAGPGTYAAYGQPGGLDRIRITKAVGGTCFMIGLVWPGNMTGGLSLPSMWGLDYARAVQPAAACNPAYLGPIMNQLDATSQSGSVSFSGSGIPAIVQSVNVTLVFASPPVWCPSSEALVTANLSVQ